MCTYHQLAYVNPIETVISRVNVINGGTWLFLFEPIMVNYVLYNFICHNIVVHWVLHQIAANQLLIFSFPLSVFFFLLWFSFSVLFVLFYLSRASERYSLCVVDKLKVSIGFQHMKYNHGNEIYLFDGFFFSLFFDQSTYAFGVCDWMHLVRRTFYLLLLLLLLFSTR